MKSNFRMAAVATISALAATTITQAASITVDPSATKQQIIGFGAGSVYYQSWITALGSTMQEALYDTAFTGLNLSLLRVGNWLQDESKGVSKDDIKIVTAGKKRLGSHMKIEMSSWSAPASLKPSGDINGKKDGVFYSGKNSTLKASSSDPYGKYAYREFASWWKRSYQAYEAAGIAPDYISFQNEPDMFAEYEETLFTPTENDTSAGYAQALNAMRDTMNTLANPPKILGPEPLGIGYNNFQKYAKALTDSKLDGYAYHLYHAGDGNDNSLANYMSPENFRSPMKAIATSYGSDARPIIMTEFCSMAENGKEEYMTGLAHIMQVGFTDGKLNGYIAWELFWGEGKGQLIGVCTKGWGSCTEDQINISPEYHAMRHYSKFVNPGWKVISSTSDNSNLYTVAFRSANGDSITVVAINKSAATELNIPIDNYTALYAVQSVENGDKSKEISPKESIPAPAKSITTVVFLSDTPNSIRTPAASNLVNDQNATAKVFDLNGNLVWSGLKGQALNADGTLRLNLRQGMYLIKTKDTTAKAIKK